MVRAHTEVWRSQGVALQHYRFTPHAPQFFTCIISLWQGSSGKKTDRKDDCDFSQTTEFI